MRIISCNTVKLERVSECILLQDMRSGTNVGASPAVRSHALSDVDQAGFQTMQCAFGHMSSPETHVS